MDENMNNYIGKVDVEWVDPKVRPPQNGSYFVRWHSGETGYSSYHEGEWGYPAVAAWLRVGGPSTAIPREQVQAAVDHLYECEEQADGGGDWAFREALDSIDHHTGVTPSEVPRD